MVFDQYLVCIPQFRLGPVLLGQVVVSSRDPALGSKSKPKSRKIHGQFVLDMNHSLLSTGLQLDPSFKILLSFEVSDASALMYKECFTVEIEQDTARGSMDKAELADPTMRRVLGTPGLTWDNVLGGAEILVFDEVIHPNLLWEDIVALTAGMDAAARSTVEKCFVNVPSPILTTLSNARENTSEWKIKIENLVSHEEVASDVSASSSQEKLYTPKASLTAGVVDDGERRTHVCTECPARFDRKGNLQRHIRLVHLRLRPFACDTCGKTFQLKQHLQFHVTSRRHEMVPPFVCTDCGKSFQNRRGYNRHMKSGHRN